MALWDVLLEPFGYGFMLRALGTAVVAAVVCAVAGLYLSYCLDTASGATVVLAQGAAFALVYLFGPRHGLLGGRLAARRRARTGA